MYWESNLTYFITVLFFWTIKREKNIVMSLPSHHLMQSIMHVHMVLFYCIDTCGLHLIFWTIQKLKQKANDLLDEIFDCCE